MICKASAYLVSNVYFGGLVGCRNNVLRTGLALDVLWSNKRLGQQRVSHFCGNLLGELQAV